MLDLSLAGIGKDRPEGSAALAASAVNLLPFDCERQLGSELHERGMRHLKPKENYTGVEHTTGYQST
jgi:hypothetical protein